MDVIKLKNGPSNEDELLKEAPSVEDERDPISKVSSWNLGIGVPLASREVPT